MSAAALEKAREFAANLTFEEKNELLDFLLIDLQNEETQINPAWIKQIEESEVEMLSGRDAGVPWSEVKANMRRIIGNP